MKSPDQRPTLSAPPARNSFQERVPGPPAELERREFRPGDERQILAAFNDVFRSGDSTRPPRTSREWRWAFLDNPGGSRIWLALEGGKVVAQSAGMGYRMWMDGRETAASQSVDSLVRPEYAGGLKKPGLFVRTVYDYIEAYANRPDAFFFGWPNQRAWRIGRRLLGYERVVRQTFLVRSTPGPGVSRPPVVETVPRFPRGVRALWERFRDEAGVSAVRDSNFLNWRFARHPTRRYDIDLVRGNQGEILGYAVGRLSNTPVEGVHVLADWLVPADQPEVGELLLQSTLARARRRGAKAVAALFPTWSPWNSRFEQAGFRPHQSERVLTLRSHDPRFDTRWFRDNWWYQLAESDLV